MANNIGYEEIIVGATAVGPALALGGANAICAIFYLDPESPSDVRYRADQTDPTASSGLPIRPGRHLVVAGKGDIVNARFVSRTGARCSIHAMYYDQVDVIAFDQGPPPIASAAQSESALLQAILIELRALRLGHIAEGICEPIRLQEVARDLIA